jgi:hypothetical protein
VQFSLVMKDAEIFVLCEIKATAQLRYEKQPLQRKINEPSYVTRWQAAKIACRAVLIPAIWG